jgi:hypothetical protein
MVAVDGLALLPVNQVVVAGVVLVLPEVKVSLLQVVRV